jgi:hypothetical protein
MTVVTTRLLRFDNTVALINAAGTDFAGARRGTLGSTNQLANTQCSWNVAAATRLVAGNNVSVTYPMTLSSGNLRREQERLPEHVRSDRQLVALGASRGADGAAMTTAANYVGI